MSAGPRLAHGSGARVRWDAVTAVVRRDAALYLSYRTRFVGQALSVLTSLTLFHFVSKLVDGGSRFADPQQYFSYVVVGVAILQMLSMSLILVPQSVRQELVAGTFERLVVSPAGPVLVIAATAVFPALFALVMAAFTLVAGAVLFGVDLQASSPLALPAALLGALAFAPVSLLMAAAVLMVRQATAGANLIITAFSVIGGFFFPVALLPGWIRWTSDVQPFTPTVELLRHLLLGTSLGTSGWITVLKLAAFAAVLTPISLVVLRAALERSQRNATVIEY